MPFAIDKIIEQLAVAQLGVVTRVQLRERGITPHAIASRVQANRLRPLHRGVYRVGPVEAPHAREMAAVLACGPHAVVSHRSAGWLWQLLPDPGDAPVDISLPKGDCGRRPGIRVHRVSLQSEDKTIREKIPVTSVRRTLIDLSVVLDSRELERVLAQTERLNLLERGELRALAARRAGRPGARLLRSLLESETGPAFTRSEAEERFLSLVRKSQLPVPECNVPLGDYEVDFFWRIERLVVEVDGFAYHGSRGQFENDRRRDAWLAANGLSVMRVTWRQVTKEPEVLIARLAQTLTRAALQRGTTL